MFDLAHLDRSKGDVVYAISLVIIHSGRRIL
jgi:hypothetical protein